MKKYIITTNHQQGSQNFIQGGHASDELALRCFVGDYKGTEKESMYLDWNRNHKTYVNLNVEDQFVLIELGDWLEKHSKELGVVTSMFKEPALNNSVTGLCFIAPKKLCENYHFIFRSFLQDVKLRKRLKSFTEFTTLNDKELFSCRNTFLDVVYDNQKELFYVKDNSEIIETYSILEAEFLMKFRFLSLK